MVPLFCSSTLMRPNPSPIFKNVPSLTKVGTAWSALLSKPPLLRLNSAPIWLMKVLAVLIRFPLRRKVPKFSTGRRNVVSKPPTLIVAPAAIVAVPVPSSVSPLSSELPVSVRLPLPWILTRS